MIQNCSESLGWMPSEGTVIFVALSLVAICGIIGIWNNWIIVDHWIDDDYFDKKKGRV